MSTIKEFTLKNSGEQINNDIVFDELYELFDNEYEFSIKPHCRYWRFGIRLSKTENVAFFHPSHRYKSPEFNDYVDIHIGVGEWLNGNWSMTNRFHLAQYNLPLYNHLLDRKDTYVERGKVIWKIIRSGSSFKILYDAPGCEPFVGDIQVPNEFKFFKVFGWADRIDFHLDASVRSPSNFLTIGNVTFKKGDLFDRAVLKQSDVIILPASSGGSVQPHIGNAATELGIPKPSQMKAGTIEVYDLKGVGRPLKAAWAHSVEGGRGSRIDIIEKICSEMLSRLANANVQSISLPLLGTGAGRLDPVDVAKKYVESLSEFAGDLKFSVYVNTNENYEKILDYFERRLAYKTRFNNTKHKFRDKNIEPALGVTDLAREIARIIIELPNDEQGAMFGIFGKWGRGKSYLMNTVWERLKEHEGYRRVDFHAWKYQDTPATWAYLYEQFADEYYKSEKWIKSFNEWNGRLWKWLNKPRKFLSKYWNKLKDWWNTLWRRFYLNRCRLGNSKLISFLISLTISVVWFIVWYIKIPQDIKKEQALKLFNYLLATIGVFGIFNLVKLFFSYKKTGGSLYKEYNSRVSLSPLMGTQAEIQRELKFIIKAWCKKEGHERIVLFVDDIDRCSEKKIIEIIDSLRVVLDDKDISERLLVVTAIDEDILQHAIKHKYEFLKEREVSDEVAQTLVSEYLDKLFLVGIKLGTLSEKEVDDFFVELTKKDCKKENVVLSEVSKNLSYQVEQRSNQLSGTTEQPFESADERVGDTVQMTKRDAGHKNSEEELMSADELLILRQSLKKYVNATPRQLRIFYYRYVVAKRMLAYRYIKSGQENYWMDAENCRLMIDLLIEYSKPQNRKQLATHKLNASANSVDNIHVDLFKYQRLGTFHYAELLQVLDTVIAY